MIKKYKILIVDDEKLNLEILRKSLDGAGYHVVEASSAVKALGILKRDNKFHVILLDRMMPEMNGMEFLKILKSDNQLKDIPVIIQSAVKETNEIANGYNEECYFYLTKPFRSSMMLNMVKKAIDSAFAAKVRSACA